MGLAGGSSASVSVLVFVFVFVYVFAFVFVFLYFFVFVFVFFSVFIFVFVYGMGSCFCSEKGLQVVAVRVKLGFEVMTGRSGSNAIFGTGCNLITPVNSPTSQSCSTKKASISE